MIENEIVVNETESGFEKEEKGCSCCWISNQATTFSDVILEESFLIQIKKMCLLQRSLSLQRVLVEEVCLRKQLFPPVLLYT